MNRLLKAVEQNGGQTLLGAALYFYDPIFLEVAALLGTPRLPSLRPRTFAAWRPGLECLP